MPKIPSSAIGIDLGRHALKAALLKKSGAARFTLASYAIHPLSQPAASADEIAQGLKTLLQSLKGSAKACSVSISHPDSIFRIIDQPETPRHLLREGLRLNGISLLNQDCRELVLDCDPLIRAAGEETPVAGKSKRIKYVVGGMPRTAIQNINEAFKKIKLPLTAIQLPPASLFNAFEFSHPEVFQNESFMLVDIGHESSTIIVGSKRELALVREVEFGGRELTKGMMAAGDCGRDAAFEALENGERAMIESARLSLNAITREISSSIGFYEGRSGETIKRIYISGGAARSPIVLGLITEEISVPCNSWSPFQSDGNALPGAQKAAFANDQCAMNVAIGAAMDLLTGK